MKKNAIYAAVAVLVLAIGIIIGLLLSKGGDDATNDGNEPVKVADGTGNTGSNTECFCQ